MNHGYIYVSIVMLNFSLFFILILENISYHMFIYITGYSWASSYLCTQTYKATKNKVTV